MVVDATEKIVVRPITVTRAIGNRWLASSGLVDGDRVIVDGLQRSRPGMTVKAVPYAPTDATPNRAIAAPAK